jgi:hypothetical protein
VVTVEFHVASFESLKRRRFSGLPFRKSQIR